MPPLRRGLGIAARRAPRHRTKKQHMVTWVDNHDVLPPLSHDDPAYSVTESIIVNADRFSNVPGLFFVDRRYVGTFCVVSSI